MKETIQLNEAQLKRIISESVKQVIKEAEMDEGFWDNVKAGFKGAKQGFNAQKAIDRGTQGFKQEHDYDDTRREMMNPFYKSENTAQEQANQLYAQAREYQAMANKLKAKANAITKQYGLVKAGVNQRQSATQTQQAPVPAFSQGQGKQLNGGLPSTKRGNTAPTGLWGK